MNLHEVERGKKVQITQIAKLDEMLRRRLSSFGIRVGSVVTVRQKCLFSGAYILECEGQQIGLRKKDIMAFEVKPL
ncbi:MAG: FeoA family protein [Bacillus sp. (in: firmicutes)]